MTSRLFLVLLGCVLANAQADAPATYQRRESFDTSPSNWRQAVRGQYYGYAITKLTGGTAAAGGYFVPTTAFNFYGDLYLSGAFDRSNSFSASGKLALPRTSGTPPYVATAYLAHFSKNGGKFVQVVGIALTGSTPTSVVATPIIQFSNGAAYEGDPITVNTTTKASGPLAWSYTWTPGGGVDGAGRLTISIGSATALLDLPSSSSGSNFSLDAFGLFQPPFSAPDSNTFLELYAGDVSYTAFPGKAPKLRVVEPKNNTPGEIIVGDGIVYFSGTAQTHLGNKVAAVRYRVIHNGKRGRWHSAKGTTSWTANVRVPSGISTVEFLARSDSGLTKTVTRKVHNYF
jgi:hypothetical protein